MEGTAVLGRLSWRVAEVIEVIDETLRVRSLVLSVPDWEGHRPGQHVDVRLTAEDGYQTARSYSIASASEPGRIELTVERLEDGEVSSYLADDMRLGDKLELRGPIGGNFTWDVEDGGPLLLIAGGSGIAPLMSMIRQRAALGSHVPARLLYSCRSFEEIIYREELARRSRSEEGLEVIQTLTRAQPPGWTGFHRRIDEEMLRDVAWPPDVRPLCYICGPTLLVETAASTLTALGHDPLRIKTERFGPTGG